MYTGLFVSKCCMSAYSDLMHAVTDWFVQRAFTPPTPPSPIIDRRARVIRPLSTMQVHMYSHHHGGTKRWGRWGPCACYYWYRGWARWMRFGCMSYGTRGAEAWVWRRDDRQWHWAGAKSRRGVYCRCYWFKNVQCYTRR